MSGDTSTCGVHLDGAAQLISHMKSYKSEYSAKARSLHRIYCYVRLIYESTAPRPTSPGLQIHRTLHLQSMDLTPDSPFLSLRERNKLPDRDLDLSSYECVYGIPQSLLAFMKRSIQMIDQVSEARKKSGTTSIPDSIAGQCDQLENELLDWDVNDYLPAADSDNDVNANIIRFQTLAFHNALIIYLSQHIRLLNHRYFHPYIQAVIQNIEEIEKIKTRKHVFGAPLYWPVFIAASEAYDKRLQERFRRWYGEVERYGIEAVKTGVQVIYQVWDEGPLPNRTTCAWRNITQRAGITLMLT
jgi:arginine metabolism regulation protein II